MMVDKKDVRKPYSIEQTSTTPNGKPIRHSRVEILSSSNQSQFQLMISFRLSDAQGDQTGNSIEEGKMWREDGRF
jgi:hypothetical protein